MNSKLYLLKSEDDVYTLRKANMEKDLMLKEIEGLKEELE